jgi:hypothetical protein
MTYLAGSVAALGVVFMAFVAVMVYDAVTRELRNVR